MKINITEKKENPLTEREEIKFEVDHKDVPTPSRAEVRKELSSKLEVPEDLIVLEKIVTLNGHQTASGKARIYDSKERLEELEPKYLIKRTEISKEKSSEKKEAEEKESEASEE